MYPLQVCVRPSEGPLATVDIAGELDIYTAPRLKAVMDGILQSGSHSVVCVLDQLTYMDSAGLGILVEAYKKLRARGGRLALVSPTPNVARVLNVTRVDRALAVYACEEDALQSSGSRYSASAQARA